MGFDDYEIVLYRQDDCSCVAEIPALGGCYTLGDSSTARGVAAGLRPTALTAAACARRPTADEGNEHSHPRPLKPRASEDGGTSPNTQLRSPVPKTDGRTAPPLRAAMSAIISG